jgi:hypothetical protein
MQPNPLLEYSMKQQWLKASVNRDIEWHEQLSCLYKISMLRVLRNRRNRKKESHSNKELLYLGIFSIDH